MKWFRASMSSRAAEAVKVITAVSIEEASKRVEYLSCAVGMLKVKAGAT